MYKLLSTTLPPLPLLLWETPPGLELILGQEGIAFAKVGEPHPLAFHGGRFVLYDGRCVSESMVRRNLSPDHVALDIDLLRREDGADPFAALVDNRGQATAWRVGRWTVTERVGRVDKGALRRALLDRLRQAVTKAGGVWARLAPYPFPYRAAFNFRADLDEPLAADYGRFARARRPLADCSTHFVSTAAYGDQPWVLDDLLRFDTQSHGHYHATYRDAEANRRNIDRAHQILREAGFDLVGFAAPHGRWNAGLDDVLEGFGYLYSSDFQLGHDDFPFFPWRGDRFSQVLQVPIHPICEGLFLDAGVGDGRVIADHFVEVVRARIDAGEPAFVYGHPERRLARFPEILAALAQTITGDALLWRVTLTEFARWWRWRSERRWSLAPKANGRLELQFEEWDASYPLALEIRRGAHVSTVPIRSARTPLRLEVLAYERREVRDALLPTVPFPRPSSLRAAVRSALDWETVTPLHDLPARTIADRVKKGLRWWRSRPAGRMPL
jgi:hypothetical protein